MSSLWFDAEVVIYASTDPPFTAEITLGSLQGYVSERELNPIKFSSAEWRHFADWYWAIQRVGSHRRGCRHWYLVQMHMGSDEGAIREVHSSWIEAVNSGDLERLLTLMTDDVVFLNPGKEPFGRREFPDGFLKGHQRSWIHCVSEIEEVAVCGEFAYTRCRDSLSVKPRAGGEPMEWAGHRMTIYRKQAGGRWLLARDAHTLTPVTP